MFRRWRERRALGKGLRTVAQEEFAKGELSVSQYESVLKSSKDKKKLDRTLHQLKREEDTLGAINWGSILQWIRDNWITILRLVIMVVMIMDEQDETPKEIK